MPTLSPRGQIPEPLGSERVTRANHDAELTAIDTNFATLLTTNTFTAANTVLVGADTLAELDEPPVLAAPGIQTGTRNVQRVYSWDTILHTRDFITRPRTSTNAGNGLLEWLTSLDGGALVSLATLDQAGNLNAVGNIVSAAGLQGQSATIGGAAIVGGVLTVDGQALFQTDVGIGTGAPGALLDVVASTTGLTARITNAAAANRPALEVVGNVQNTSWNGTGNLGQIGLWNSAGNGHWSSLDFFDQAFPTLPMARIAAKEDDTNGTTLVLGINNLYSSSLGLAGLALAPNNTYGAAFVGVAGVLAPTYALTLPNNANVSGQAIANQWVQYSSAAGKADPQPLGPVLARIQQVGAVSYTPTTDEPADAAGLPRQVGFLAEDMAAVFPEVVASDERGAAVGIAYGNVGAILWEGLKEALGQIASMQTQLDALHGTIAGADSARTTETGGPV